MTILIQSHCRSILLSTALAAIGVLAVNGSAGAAEQLEPLIKQVTYTDLNVESAAGAKTLYTRLRHAAEEVCRPLDSVDLARKNLWQECYNSALNAAVVRVNKSALTALHLQTSTQAAKG